ncbi:MAG TPA: CRTAC1 family protein [Planctomycetaceae bacterium]|nr:CRTAC1 family protein [Planctomycetaceae bacterium]
MFGVSNEEVEEAEEERDDAVIGAAVRYSLIAITVIAIVVASPIAYFKLTRQKTEVAEVKPVDLPEVRFENAPELPAIPWADITETSGIEFVHINGASGEKLLPETMGGGSAFFDYNGDGFPDILFVASKRWDHDPKPSTDTNDSVTAPSSLRLYKNDGTGKFTDVTSDVGLDVVMYGQGCAVGDFDNDGKPDIFVSGVSETTAGTGPNRLFRNLGESFVDVTQEAGLSGGPGDWSTSCGWFDYDNDGDLDLWVCNYVQWSREFDLAQNFRLTGGQRAYGRPQAFGGMFPRLYRNDGGLKFTDVSEEAGIRVIAPTTGTPLAKSLGIVFHDFDQDGYMDVMVANDTVQNNLFRNMGNGTFREMATLAGVAFDSDGNARGAMGIDVACARQDNRCACVAIGNFSNEMTAFYVSSPGGMVFTDQAVANGLGPSTRLFLTFGVFFFDADLDGWDDIFHANGHLEEDIAKAQSSQTYAQSPQLFWNAGPESATEFVALPIESTGKDLAAPMVGRGATYADIDGDGDLDVLITASGAQPRLLRNDQQLGNQWIRVRLVGNGTTCNRDAIGSRVEVKLKSGRILSKFVNPTRSYLSQVELPLTFGLGNEALESIKVIWPNRSEQIVDAAEVNRLLEVRQLP